MCAKICNRLRYDTESTSVLMPERHQDYKFPEKAVLLFMESKIDQYIASHTVKSSEILYV